MLMLVLPSSVWRLAQACLVTRAQGIKLLPVRHVGIVFGVQVARRINGNSVSMCHALSTNRSTSMLANFTINKRDRSLAGKGPAMVEHL